MNKNYEFIISGILVIMLLIVTIIRPRVFSTTIPLLIFVAMILATEIIMTLLKNHDINQIQTNKT
jgi:glucan phosphoethanolaminetransferase (alkaline phosphatase superfamily)